MDQSEIDALMAGNGAPKNVKAPKEKVQPQAPPAAKVTEAVQADDPKGHVISELDAVTAVTERETNKIMDQLDLISGLVGKQQALIAEVGRHGGAKDPSVQEAVNAAMRAGNDIQAKVYEAMDLMQFQDISRQKLERIVHHLRQIHDYIVELLGTGLKSEGYRPSISRTIASTGTTPDEKRAHADSVVEDFKRSQRKD